MYPAYIVLLLTGASYLLVRPREFDLFLVMFGGCAFYFLPLHVGFVPDWNVENPFTREIPLPLDSYVIAFVVTATTLVAAIVYDYFLFSRLRIREAADRSLADWYLCLAIVGLIGAISSGRIIDLNKTLVITQIGYWFVLFEFAAGLAWIDAYRHQRNLQLWIASGLLAVDLAIGFRMMAVMVFFAYLIIKFGRYGRIRQSRNLASAGFAALVMFAAMVSINTFRNYALQHAGVSYSELPSPASREPSAKQPTTPQRATQPIAVRTSGYSPEAIKNSLLFGLKGMEPFVTQAILSATITRKFECSGRLRTLLFAIPLAGQLFGVPPTFEEEFKPVLFPRQWAGMAGNVWAENFCGFGYVGVIAAAMAIAGSLLLMQCLLVARLNTSLAPALLLSGVLLAFYVHRNDMFFELLLIRRALLVYAMAWIMWLGWQLFAFAVSNKSALKSSSGTAAIAALPIWASLTKAIRQSSS
jgi:hypothetical protein